MGVMGTMERRDPTLFFQTLVKKYGGGAGSQINVPPSYFLNRFAADANVSFLEGIFTSPFSLYKRGVGKSVYCLKTLYYVYRKNIDRSLRHVVFLPQHFLSLFKEAIDRNKRVKMIFWDDAGFWLGSQRWQTEFVKSVREFMNVIRTHVVTIMISAPAPTEVARGIRDNLDVLGFAKIHDSYFELEKRRSVIFLYDSDTWSLRQGRVYPPPMVQWIYKQYLEWYPRYEEKRKEYVRIGLQKAVESLKYVSERAAAEFREILSGYEPRPRDLGEEEGREDAAAEIETIMGEEIDGKEHYDVA